MAFNMKTLNPLISQNKLLSLFVTSFHQSCSWLPLHCSHSESLLLSSLFPFSLLLLLSLSFKNKVLVLICTTGNGSTFQEGGCTKYPVTGHIIQKCFEEKNECSTACKLLLYKVVNHIGLKYFLKDHLHMFSQESCCLFVSRVGWLPGLPRSPLFQRYVSLFAEDPQSWELFQKLFHSIVRSYSL